MSCRFPRLRLDSAAMALGGIALTLGGFVLQQSLMAQDPQSGWLEGTVVNQRGQAPWKSSCNSLCGVEVRVLGTSKVKMDTDRSLGGFYSFRDLKPGVYEVFVEKTTFDATTYRPQHIHGVIIKPGVRTTLKIVVNEGVEMEDVGTPVVGSEPAVIISQALERLQKQIDELKKK